MIALLGLLLPDLSTEDTLLARAKRGDQSAVMEIYERYSPALYHYIRLRVGEAVLAEDLTGDVFVELVGALQKHKAPRQSLRGWLFAVARHKIARHYRQEEKMPQVTLDDWLPAGGEDDPEVRFMQSLDVAQARQAFRRLNAEQQEVLILRFGQLLDLAQTADVMGKSTSAIKSLQFRAVESLRQALSVLNTEVANG